MPYGWHVEVYFKQLQSNGPDLEEMNAEGKEKRHLMMALAIREEMLEEYRKGHNVLLKKIRVLDLTNELHLSFEKGRY